MIFIIITNKKNNTNIEAKTIATVLLMNAMPRTMQIAIAIIGHQNITDITKALNARNTISMAFNMKSRILFIFVFL